MIGAGAPGHEQPVFKKGDVHVVVGGLGREGVGGGRAVAVGPGVVRGGREVYY